MSLDEQFTDTLLADEEKAGTSSVPVTGSFEITYNQPAAGKVELYWKGQLAKTLVFTVNPKA